MREKDNYWLRLRGRRLTRRSFLAGTGVAAAGSAAILAGCGDDDDDDDAGPAATQAAATQAAATEAAAAEAEAEAEATEAAAAATEAPAAADSRRGGTFRTWKSTEDQGLDPAIYHTNNGEVTAKVYNHLLDFQVSKGVFGLDAATGFEQVDDTTLVWAVREGMKFHNGDPVTTEDVAYTIARPPVLYAELGSTHQPASNFRYLDLVEAIDDTHVQENWAEPRADALIHRSRQYFGIVNKALVEAQDGKAQDHVRGMAAGPYILSERNAEGTHLVRNPDYYAHPNPDDGFVEDGPYIDEIDVRVIPDLVTARSLLESGDLDAYGTLDALEAEELEKNDRVAVEAAPAGGWAVLGYDGGKFRDQRAREAIRKGFNYQAFNASIRAGDGKFQAPLTITNGRFQRLSQEDLAGWYTYDPADARALWEAAANDAKSHPASDAAYDKIYEGVEIHTVTNDIQQQISEFAARSLQDAIGVPFDVTSADIQTWVNAATDRTEDVKQWDLLQSGTGVGGGTDGTPGTNYLSWFDPLQYALNAFNFHYDSPHPEILEGATIVGDMMAAQNVEFDHEARVQIITDLQRWIMDNAWSIFMMPMAGTAFLGMSSRLRDYGKDDWSNAYSVSNVPRRQAAWLDDA